MTRTCDKCKTKLTNGHGFVFDPTSLKCGSCEYPKRPRKGKRK